MVAETEPARWQTCTENGETAFRLGHYAEAEGLFVTAVELAEKFGSEDARLALSLNNLAELYHAEGKYTACEALYRRSLSTREKILGMEHRDVATVLNNLGELYRVQGRYRHADAEPSLFRRRRWDQSILTSP